MESGRSVVTRNQRRSIRIDRRREDDVRLRAELRSPETVGVGAAEDGLVIRIRTAEEATLRGGSG